MREMAAMDASVEADASLEDDLHTLRQAVAQVLLAVLAPRASFLFPHFDAPSGGLLEAYPRLELCLQILPVRK